jgi:predicted  nucleic acid-binding Zn-ribbon protein
MSAPACVACGEPLRYADTKRGGYSVACASCGFQGFIKTPKAAQAFASRLAPADPPAAKPAPPAGKPAVKRISDAELFGE